MSPQASRCEDYNAIVLDLPDGSRARMWLTRTTRNGRVRVVLDAPRSVVITRGKLIGAAAKAPETDPKA